MNLDGLTPRPVAERLRLLLADGSAISARAVCEALRDSPEIEILGIVEDGNEAIAKVRELKPGVLLLAMDIPKGDGARVLREVMATCPVPTIMLGADQSSGGAAAAKLIEQGAVEAIARPQTLSDERAAREWRATLASTVRRAGRVKVVRMIARAGGDLSAMTPTPRGFSGVGEIGELRSPSPLSLGSGTPLRRIVLVGSSTGGPDALRVLVRDLPEGFPHPIVIAQHMPEGFTVSLAGVLQAECKLVVREAVDGERIRAGTVYVGPGGMHLRIRNGGLLEVVRPATREEHCPSVDMLFRTGSAVYGSGVLAVVLTGIGSDGSAGIRTVHACGGRVVAQDEASSRIYGMPQAAVGTGCVDVVAAIGDIGPLIARHALGARA